MLCWLNANAGAVQAFAAVFAALIAIPTLIYLIKAYGAYDRQATASNAQVTAANAQADAANRAVDAANTQVIAANKAVDAANAQAEAARDSAKASQDAVATAREQIELLLKDRADALVPFLVLLVSPEPGLFSYALRNEGRGTAIHIRVNGPDEARIGLTQSTIGAGFEARLNTTISGLNGEVKITYTGANGLTYVSHANVDRKEVTQVWDVQQ